MGRHTGKERACAARHISFLKCFSTVVDTFRMTIGVSKRVKRVCEKEEKWVWI